MTPRMVIVSSIFAGLAAILIAVIWAGRARAAPDVAATSAFAGEVDLTPLDRVAVHDDGRLKSFGSFASSMMQYVSGPHEINGNPDAFSYLDLMLRPEAYEDVPVVYVKSKPLRAEIVETLRRSIDAEVAPEMRAEAQLALEDRMGGFRRSGLVTTAMLLDPQVQQMLALKERDLIRTSRAVGQIRTGLAVSQPQVLQQSLRIVPPPGGGLDEPWLTVEQYAAGPGAGADPAARAEVRGAWQELALGWRGQDARRVSAAAAKLAAALPRVNPGLYPDLQQLSLESWYFKARNMTWVWMIYLLSVVLLVMAVVYRWRPAGICGLGVFLVAFAFHTAAIWVRWQASGRWPNANMFEAVTTSVWFGGCFAVILELLVRRTALRYNFALGSAVASMVALMCAHFMPVSLNPNFTNKMPVLHDVWLYIHTNVIIFSYVLIAMAAVSALLYVVYRLGGGAASFVRAGGAGALLARRPDGGTELAEGRTNAGQVFDGATMVLMELAFVLLWAGLVMGAIWADHSWGRPWGWDPKEVFALNTFIVLALLVHVRLKVRDKGLWTALLALAGFVVMLFNWIFINFWIVGLHSYA